MIWNILQLIFCITLFVLPLALYKSHRSFMVRFYDAMIHSVKARKLYVQVVLILLLLFHYVYISGHVGEFGVFLSTAICATIYSFRRADRLLRGLCDRPCMFVILSLVALAISFVPHLYTTAVTAAYLLLAALFYPSVRVMTEFQDIGIISEWMKFPRLLAESYYDHHHAILPQDADSGNTNISAQ
jgi:hypothetical protein